MSTGQTFSSRVAGEVRAEMARQRKTGVELASHLQISQQSASRRLTGETDFDLDEVASIAEWLDVDLYQLIAPVPKAFVG